MPDDNRRKSTPDEIRARFDQDVERFSNLDAAQESTVDAAFAMALVAEAAATTTPDARDVLDVGCGAGNYSLKLLARLPNLNFTLVDLSRPMLDRAVERLRPKTSGTIQPIQGDIRQVDLGRERFDVVMAAAVLHHLRDEEEWRAVFTNFHAALRPGGSLWIFDLIESSLPSVSRLMWARYGEYLCSLKGEAYRNHVFDYVAREDTPRPLVFQLDLLREVGFAAVDVLHKNGCFAAFGALKGQ